MLGNLWMPGIALIAGTLPLPQAGKAQRPSPPAVFSAAEKVPGQLGILCQGTGMWGMQGRGQGRGGGCKRPARWKEEANLGEVSAGKTSPPSLPSGPGSRNWRELGCVSAFQCRSQKPPIERIGFFKITASVVWSRWLPGTPCTSPTPPPRVHKGMR